MNLMIIGDAHAHPDYDNSRFDKLGKFIVKSKPDIIVCMGDFAAMPRRLPAVKKFLNKCISFVVIHF